MVTSVRILLLMRVVCHCHCLGLINGLLMKRTIIRGILPPPVCFKFKTEVRSHMQLFNNVDENDNNDNNMEDMASFMLSSPAIVDFATEQENQKQPISFSTYQNVMAQTIGNPIWNSYIVSLTKKPIITKAFYSMVGFLLGDVIAQFLFNKVIF